MSGIVHKVKEALHSDKDKTNNVPEGTAGPHNSRVANAADPRVDSDMDGSHRNTHAGAGTGMTGSSGLGHTGAHTGAHTGTSGLGHNGTAGGYATGPAHHTAGPHKSDAMNKADPRVDSDLDGSRTAGGAGYGTSGMTGTHGTSGLSGTHGTGAAGAYGSSGLTGTHGTGVTGTHGTSGLSGTHNPTTGFNDPTGTHGPHNSRVANAADPRVDSDRDHRGTHHTSGLGSGPAPNTAGPHKSDVLNKVDPRVDSDRDGSKTLGNNNNQTYRAPDSTMRDPTDASQVPPSVLKKHVGDPVIEHDDKHHNYARRNSVPSAQETHRGI